MLVLVSCWWVFDWLVLIVALLFAGVVSLCLVLVVMQMVCAVGLFMITVLMVDFGFVIMVFTLLFACVV